MAGTCGYSRPMKFIGLRRLISNHALAYLLVGCGPSSDVKSPADTDTDSADSVGSGASTETGESNSTEAETANDPSPMDADLEKQEGEADTERARRLANNTESRTNQVIADTVAKNRTDIRGCAQAHGHPG